MLYLYRQAGAGTLHVRGEQGEAVVRVRQGRPVAARATLPDMPSGDLLQLLLPLCGWRSGVFAFYASDMLETLNTEALAQSAVVTGALDPYALLYASIHEHARDDMVDGVLARYPSNLLSVPLDRDIGRLGLNEQDRAFAEGLRRAPATVAAAVAGAQLASRHARRLLYALLVTHMLAPDEERGGDSYKSQAGDEDTPPLEVPMPSAAASARAAPVARPSQAPPIAGSVNDVGSAARPAWQQLMSMRVVASAEAAKRGETAIPSLRPPSGLRGSMATAANDPPARKRRVDTYMQAGRFAEALALLEELVAGEANNAKLHGLRARALFEVHRADPNGLPRTVVEAIKRAHELDPDEANAFLTRGLVYKQAGELQKAQACWKRALQTDQNNIDALRELRLIKLRG
jgi:tetratricopeptide (TPR) repeat protein